MRLLHLLKKVLFPAYSAVIVVPRVQGPKACKFHEDNYNCSSDVVRKAFMKISENSVEQFNTPCSINVVTPCEAVASPQKGAFSCL